MQSIGKEGTKWSFLEDEMTKKYSWGAGQSTGEKKAVTKRVQ